MSGYRAGDNDASHIIVLPQRVWIAFEDKSGVAKETITKPYQKTAPLGGFLMYPSWCRAPESNWARLPLPKQIGLYHPPFWRSGARAGVLLGLTC